MENTTDIDLQELEARLYSQVFHSTENWDTPSDENLNLNDIQTRHVSPYAVSNVTVNGNRYWDAKNLITKTTQNDDGIISKENTVEQQNDPKTMNIVPNPFHAHKESFPHLDSIIPLENESIIPLENVILQEYRTKPLRYKSVFIPTTLKLPKSKIKKLPDYIIQYFDLNSYEKKRRFRAFLRFLERKDNNNKNDSKQNNSLNTTEQKYMSPPKITITANGIDRKMKLFGIPIPMHKDTKTSANIEIITLSDSDSDSVIEIPLPPVPVYAVDSSSETESEELEKDSTKNISKNEEMIQEILVQDKIENDSLKNSHDNNEKIQICEPEDLHNTDKNTKKNKKKIVDMNASLTELEKDRDDFLHTPDSNTNDFLEHDVSNLSKNSFSFNFGLHSSDLDLSKDKDESVTKSGISTNDHDLYETESSCSEIGSVISKTRPVFNEINFESPIKDIFCEPDLSKFSNFITPNRNPPSLSKQNKIRSNVLFSPITTKAFEKTQDKKGRTRSDSSEYHSDPTTLKIKKKNKKIKKKSKKRGKQTEDMDENSEGELLSKETMKINLDQAPTPSILPEKSVSSPKQIDKPSTSSASINEPCSSPTDYYIDTYFADDCLLLEELEKQHEKSDNAESKIAVIDNEKNEEAYKLPNVSTTKDNDNENLNFSFVDTWRKSTDNADRAGPNVDEKNTTNKIENDASPNKILKVNTSPTVHPYIVSISSDEESDTSVVSVKTTDKTNFRKRTITLDDNNCPDLKVVNIKNDKSPSKNTQKKNIVANPFSFVNTFHEHQEKKTFKDFWTNDMTKFYDESWGQENFDVDKTQSSMSGNTSDWKIIHEDLYRMSRRKRGPLCLRCREFGHSQYNCSRFSGPMKCSTCGMAGHSTTRCPNSICTTCRHSANHHTTSCGRCAHFRTILCNLCNNVGHEAKNCPDLWRRYHLTTTSHTELNTSASILKPPNERWCANCARKGHCDDKCTNLRHEHFPTTPGIISYAPTYDEVFKLPATPPSPNIPMFKNTNVTINDLRNMKQNVIQDSNKKYINILKKLKQQCNKVDVQLIKQIDRLRRNMNNQEFSKKKIQEIYKLRARVARNNIY